MPRVCCTRYGPKINNQLPVGSLCVYFIQIKVFEHDVAGENSLRAFYFPRSLAAHSGKGQSTIGQDQRLGLADVCPCALLVVIEEAGFDWKLSPTELDRVR